MSYLGATVMMSSRDDLVVGGRAAAQVAKLPIVSCSGVSGQAPHCVFHRRRGHLCTATRQTTGRQRTRGKQLQNTRIESKVQRCAVGVAVQVACVTWPCVACRVVAWSCGHRDHAGSVRGVTVRSVCAAWPCVAWPCRQRGSAVGVHRASAPTHLASCMFKVQPPPSLSL